MRYKNRVKLLREARGLTQRDLAARLKVTPATVAQWETGVNGLSLKNAVALAARVVPSLVRRPMIQTVVRLYNDLKRFDDEHSMDALLEIAEDDRVDAGERAEFDGIVQDLQEILKTSLELAMFLNEGV